MSQMVAVVESDYAVRRRGAQLDSGLREIVAVSEPTLPRWRLVATSWQPGEPTHWWYERMMPRGRRALLTSLVTSAPGWTSRGRPYPRVKLGRGRRLHDGRLRKLRRR